MAIRSIGCLFFIFIVFLLSKGGLIISNESCMYEGKSNKTGREQSSPRTGRVDVLNAFSIVFRWLFFLVFGAVSDRCGMFRVVRKKAVSRGPWPRTAPRLNPTASLSRSCCPVTISYSFAYLQLTTTSHSQTEYNKWNGITKLLEGKKIWGKRGCEGFWGFKGRSFDLKYSQVSQFVCCSGRFLNRTLQPSYASSV